MSRTLSEPIPLPGHPLWPKQPLLAKDNPSQFLKQVTFFQVVVVMMTTTTMIDFYSTISYALRSKSEKNPGNFQMSVAGKQQDRLWG